MRFSALVPTICLSATLLACEDALLPEGDPAPVEAVETMTCIEACAGCDDGACVARCETLQNVLGPDQKAPWTACMALDACNADHAPNGFDENLDLGPNTQCYNRVEMTFSGGIFSLSTTLGTYGDMMCDRATPGGDLMFDTTGHIINGTGDCFDIDLTFAGFAQEGRGALDGDTLWLEVYFSGQAANHRCADGEVGGAGVVINGNAFEGDAVQVFRIQGE